MSEISPDIKLEDLNFIKDKVIESKEDSSFDLVSELRLKSQQPSTTTDSIKFKTFCRLFRPKLNQLTYFLNETSELPIILICLC